MTYIRPLFPAKSGIMTREEKKRSYPQSDRFNRHSWLDSMWGRDTINIRGGYEPISVGERSYIGQRRDQYETITAVSCPPTYCAKASCAQPHDIPLRSDTQALRLIASILFIQQREKHRSREEKKRLPIVVFFYLCT